MQFLHVGSGLATRGDGELRGFEVAAGSGPFAKATARIDGDSVVVTSDAVPHPVFVRYGWTDDPDCNLINKEGLPASPFRTDRRPGVTKDAL